MGVLISGRSGVGKSELALELITRGHCLIADDAALFVQAQDGGIQGSCPSVIRNYLHVRAVGLLDIVALFGAQAVRADTCLELVVELEDGGSTDLYSLHGADAPTRSVLNREIEMVRLDAASRRLAILVECLARRHRSRLQGHCATADFSARHAQVMHSAAL